MVLIKDYHCKRLGVEVAINLESALKIESFAAARGKGGRKGSVIILNFTHPAPFCVYPRTLPKRRSRALLHERPTRWLG
eukprot:799435-Prymnesium_polylepis.1